MAVPTVYRLHSVVLDPASSAVLIQAQTSLEITNEVQVIRDLTGGSVFAQSARLITPNLGLRFSSFQLPELYALLGANLAICFPAADVYLAQYDCASIVPGASHIRYRLAGGVLFLDSLNADHRQDAQLNIRMLAIAPDSVNPPILKTSGVSLPSIAPYTRRWTMHQAFVNGQPAQGKQALQVSYNVSASTQGADSEDFDTWLTIDSILPDITVRSLDIGWYGDGETGGSPPGTGLLIRAAGQPVQSVDTGFWLRERDVSLATPTHIRLGVNGPAHFESFVSASSPTDDATVTLRLSPVQDAAGNPPILHAINQPFVAV